ncbi:MAG: dTMP kinase, partial [Saprospiraceae bacterium]
MSKDSMFIVIEGLDGSGKTSVSRQLAYFLQLAFDKKVKLTFEPHDPSCGGLFIRQVLEKKISDFSHETLALAFAANRMDHCDREINSWLNEEGSIVICDRYYLSSLVYQSNEKFPLEEVMDINSHARKPDLIFFLDVSNEVCYERMNIRNKPRELFEENLSATRNKYYKAISFLRETKKETIVNIDASGTIEEVLKEMVASIVKHKPAWQNELLSLFKSFHLIQPHVFDLNGHLPTKVSDSLAALSNIVLQDKDSFDIKNTTEKASFVRSGIDKVFDNYDFTNLGSIFLDY